MGPKTTALKPKGSDEESDSSQEENDEDETFVNEISQHLEDLREKQGREKGRAMRKPRKPRNLSSHKKLL
jgi:hypothetical protein